MKTDSISHSMMIIIIIIRNKMKMMNKSKLKPHPLVILERICLRKGRDQCWPVPLVSYPYHPQ